MSVSASVVEPPDEPPEDPPEDPPEELELPVTVTAIDPTVSLSVVAVMVTFPAFLPVKIPSSPPDPPQLAVLTDRIVVSELRHVVSFPIHVVFPSESLAVSVTEAPTAIVVVAGWILTVGPTDAAWASTASLANAASCGAVGDEGESLHATNVDTSATQSAAAGETN